MTGRAEIPEANSVRGDLTWSEVARRAVIPSVVALVALVFGLSGLAWFAGLAALGMVGIGLLRPSLARRFDQALGELAASIATVVGRILAVLGWVVLVFPVWAVGSIVPALERRRVGGQSLGWVRTTSESRTSFTKTFSSPPARGPNWPFRAVAFFGAVALGALGALFWAGGGSANSGVLQSASPVILRPQVFEPEAEAWALSYAFAEEPWAQEAIADAASISGRPDPVLGWRSNDLVSKHVNIVDGRRVSWTPPNPTITVWFFGGSTMFGDGQRDGHTIPSAVARAAAADGVQIEAVNFGVGSYNNFQETMTFVQALEEMPPPDMAVFYDGANEWSTALERANFGEVDPSRIYYQAASEEERADRVARAPELTLSSDQQFEAVVDLGAAQYRRGVRIAEAAAAAKGVEIVHIWQPGVWSTPVRPFTDELLDRWQLTSESLEQIRSLMQQMKERSGVNPVDLSDALAEVDQPTFFDPAHTNELGARVVGERLYTLIRPMLNA